MPPGNGSSCFIHDACFTGGDGDTGARPAAGLPRCTHLLPTRHSSASFLLASRGPSAAALPLWPARSACGELRAPSDPCLCTLLPPRWSPSRGPGPSAHSRLPWLPAALPSVGSLPSCFGGSGVWGPLPARLQLSPVRGGGVAFHCRPARCLDVAVSFPAPPCRPRAPVPTTRGLCLPLDWTFTWVGPGGLCNHASVTVLLTSWSLEVQGRGRARILRSDAQVMNSVTHPLLRTLGVSALDP